MLYLKRKYHFAIDQKLLSKMAVPQLLKSFLNQPTAI